MKRLTVPFLGIAFLISSCAKDTRVIPQQEGMDDVTGRLCASDEVLQRQIAENPARKAFLDELEIKTQHFIPSESRFNGKLYVPVVVHIVTANPAAITDAQIETQMAVLNKDYGKTNTELSNSGVYLAGYSLTNVANCQIEFYTKQIIRKTTASAFGTNDAVKRSSSGGSDAVNPTTMLNLWVCDLSSGLLGYAQFPGGAPATDGVVIDYQAFGTTGSLYTQFNLGRTATHEIGHWFNLRHIWGDRRCGSDLVDDTPAHDASNAGCPSNTHLSRCAGKPREQWMNYMDYTDDRCMYMFSAGQKTRMDAAIDAARSSYVYQAKI